MVDSEAIQREADRLYAALNEEDIPKKVMRSGFVDYSEASKNELVARVARTFTPAPQGALLARLLFIRTAGNEACMRTVFITNLRSPDPDARKASLLGLQELGYAGLPDLALGALRDDADAVVAAAIQILLPDAKKDPRLRPLLEDFHKARRHSAEFYTSVSLLEAHGITAPPET